MRSTTRARFGLRLSHDGGDYARQGQYELGEVYALTVNRGQPVLIQRASAPGRVELLISQQYRIVEVEGERGPYKVETRGYMYAVATHAGQEIVAYHWHPGGPSLFRRPHLHFEAGAQVTNGEIAAAHFPTGRVSVEQFLRFAIETFRLRTRRTVPRLDLLEVASAAAVA